MAIHRIRSLIRLSWRMPQTHPAECAAALARAVEALPNPEHVSAVHAGLDGAYIDCMISESSDSTTAGDLCANVAKAIGPKVLSGKVTVGTVRP